MRKTIALLLFLVAMPLFATKPCPPPPCTIIPGNRFDEATCNQKADWVALGHVVNIRHHPAPYPMLKDFADFTFVIDRWIKGGEASIKEIPFQVGWCENQQVIRGEGKYRFWGINKANVKDAQWYYLHFEKLPDEK